MKGLLNLQLRELEREGELLKVDDKKFPNKAGSPFSAPPQAVDLQGITP